MLLTHTHSDHWHERTLAHLHKRRIPIYCHGKHQDALQVYSPAFAALQADKLVRTYDDSRDLVLASGLICRPLALRHDSIATFGFRLQAEHDLFGQAFALGYVADLGCWDQKLARRVADVDLLALEFNHDVEMQYASGRSPHLIARVLGDEGHLSNEQAAALLREVLRSSAPGRLRHVVQLHLSRECNQPALAVEAAREVLSGVNQTVELHTASQNRPGPVLHVGLVMS